MRLNRHLPDQSVGAVAMTDSTGHYRFQFDSFPEPLDSVTWLAGPPGCKVAYREYSAAPTPATPDAGPITVTQMLVLATTLPPATGVVGRLCGIVSDTVFGYSGFLRLVIQGAAPVGPTGDVVVTGEWNINWEPSYVDNNGTVVGLLTDTTVVLSFEEQSLGPACPTVQWSASVDSAGHWGQFTPVIAGNGPCMWAYHPVMLTRDTASGPWPY